MTVLLFIVVIGFLASVAKFLLLLGNDTTPYECRSINTRTVEPDSYKPELAKEVLAEINEYRSEKNLPLVTESRYICDFATVRSIEVNTDYSHDKFSARLDDTNYWQYTAHAYYGENIARYFETATDMVIAWSNSPTHKEILEKAEVTSGCVSCYKDYCVYNYITLIP